MHICFSEGQEMLLEVMVFCGVGCRLLLPLAAKSLSIEDVL